MADAVEIMTGNGVPIDSLIAAFSAPAKGVSTDEESEFLRELQAFQQSPGRL